MPDWITVPEAERLSGYHANHVRRLIRRGAIRAQKWGRDWQVSRSSLLAYLQKTKKAGAKRGPKPVQG